MITNLFVYQFFFNVNASLRNAKQLQQGNKTYLILLPVNNPCMMVQNEYYF
jgi:hypothetical protein